MSSVEEELLEQEYRVFMEQDLPQSLEEYIDMCINENWALCALITSGTEAKEPSIGLDWGAGKSTFAMSLCFLYCFKYDEMIPDWVVPKEIWDRYDLDSYPVRRAWEKMKMHMAYGPPDVLEIIMRGYRVPCLVWDDINVTAGKGKSHYGWIREFADDLKNKRPYFACLLGTASHINDLAAALRPLWHFEIIIPRRGVYEVQFYKRRKYFWNPRVDLEKLRYMGTGTYPDVPPDIRAWYERWRDLKAMTYTKKIVVPKILEAFGITEEDWEKMRIMAPELEEEEKMTLERLADALSPEEIFAIDVIACKGTITKQYVQYYENEAPQLRRGVEKLIQRRLARRLKGELRNRIALTEKGERIYTILRKRGKIGKIRQYPILDMIAKARTLNTN